MGLASPIPNTALRLDIEHTDGKAYFSPPPEPRVGFSPVESLGFKFFGLGLRMLKHVFRMISAGTAVVLS